MNEQRNLILAIVLSLVVMVGYSLIVELPRQQERVAETQEETAQGEQDGAIQPEPGETGGEPATTSAASGADTAPAQLDRERTTVLQESPRVEIDTPRVHGSINLEGGRLDDLELRTYRQELAEDSDPVVLLEPEGTGSGYYADYGWVTAGDSVTLPDSDTRWQADGERLTPDNPVTLTWESPEGMIFRQRYSINDDYMFTVERSVENNTGEAVDIFPFGRVTRTGTPETSRFFILHEGPIGVFGDALQEFGYGDIRDGGVAYEDSAGWLGFTDKYWLVSLIPDQGDSFEANYRHTEIAGTDRYQSDYRGEGVRLGDGASHSVESRLFAGAKEVELLDRHREEGGVPLFDRAVDFGWFYFMTKPFFYALDWFAGWLGNFGLAIIAFTICLRVVLFPLAHKSFKAMNKMKQLQPKMMELREQYGDDRQRLNQEMMQLYRQEKVNPAAGCLPILVQIPIFFALYKVLFVTIEMRHAPFVGYLRDLSAPDPTSIFNLFGLLPFELPQLLTIGFLPILMGATMWLQIRMNPAPTDSIQVKIFNWLPLVLIVILSNFPAGLVLYWTSNNVLSMLQQYILMKRMGVEIGLKIPFLNRRGTAGEASGS